MNDQTPKPSWRDRMRPAELLIMAGVFGVFVGGFVLMGSRTWQLALIMAGVASLVVIATLLIAVTPTPGNRVDPVDPDAPTGTAGSVHRDPHTKRKD